MSSPDAAARAAVGGEPPPRASKGDVSPVVPPGDAALWADGVLRAAERPVRRLEGLLSRFLPDAWNPILQSGAFATAMLLVATITGVLVLPFYTPSVQGAHASMLAMDARPWTTGLLRSLHRYSSDAAMLFSALHLVRLLLARRVAGSRWLSWVSGTALLVTLGVVGWLGYWLVWDQRGALVAESTARLLDTLPFFAAPIARSFLTDATLSSTLFFVVFFVHMLLPLAMGIGLWIHVLRVSRARFLPSRAAWIGLCLWLVVVSLLVPATAGPVARMDAVPLGMPLDAWFLLPLPLVGALGAGLTFASFAGAHVALALFPWLLRRRGARVAEVKASSCNACSQCVTDCPYGAIRLVPRGTAAGRAELLAEVDPSRCVGCGICSGSCEPGGIGLPWMTSLQERAIVDAWAAADAAAGTPRVIAWACADALSPSLVVDRATGLTSVDGCRVVVVPCAGFVHVLTIERALRKGAPAVVIFSCGSSCRYREGGGILAERLAGTRAPSLRDEKVDPQRVHVVDAGVLGPALLRDTLARVTAGLPEAPPARRVPLPVVAAWVLAAAALLAAPMVALSRIPVAWPAREGGELVVSFRHPGAVVENCRDLTPEEIAAQPPHMRRTRECVRARVPVRLRVTVDGVTIHESRHLGAGLWHDGESSAMVTLAPGAGAHHVLMELGDGADESEWTWRAEREVSFSTGARRVVLFDRERGFSWH